jgi:hypothetical protein
MLQMPFEDPENNMQSWVLFLTIPFTLCSEMFNEWTLELKAMADRIISMRQQLFDALKARGTSYLQLLYPLSQLCS